MGKLIKIGERTAKSSFETAPIQRSLPKKNTLKLPERTAVPGREKTAHKPVAQKNPTFGERVGKGAKSTAYRLGGSGVLLAEGVMENAQAVAKADQERNRDFTPSTFDVDPATFQKVENTSGFDIDPATVELNPNKGMEKYDKAIDKNSLGMRLMRKANEYAGEAVEGLKGAPRLAADAALSISQNVAVAPTALINPLLPAVLLGAQATADKAYEATESGNKASEAMGRGTVSGAIEGATEAFGFGALLDLVKIGGKAILKGILKQIGVEATEEAVSYTLNYLADKASKDPNAKFDVNDLLYSAAVGGLSGGFFGTVGTGANTAATDIAVGRQVKDNGQVYAVLERGMNAQEGSKVRRTAESIYNTLEKSDNGMAAVSDARMGRLVKAMQKDAVQNAKPAAQTAQVAQAPAVQTVEKPAVQKVGRSVQAFIQAGDSPAAAEVKGAVMDRILAGDTTVSGKDLRSIGMSAPSTKAVFTQLTGIDVPSTTDTNTLLTTYRSAILRAAELKAQIVAQAEARTEEAATPMQEQGETSAQVEEMDHAAQSAPESEVPVAAPAAVQTAEEEDPWNGGKTAAPVPEQAFAETADQEGPTVQVTGGRSMDRAQFTRAYLAATPGATEADAERAFALAGQANGFGQEYPMPQSVERYKVGKGIRQSKAEKVAQAQRKARAGNTVRAENTDTAGQVEAVQESGDTAGEGESAVHADAAPEADAGAEKQARGDVDAAETEKAAETAAEPVEEAGERELSKVQKLVLRDLNRAVKSSGITVEVVYGDETLGEANGYYAKNTGRLVLNGDVMNEAQLLIETAAHELVHAGVKTDEGLVQSLLDFGVALKGQAAMDRNLEELRERYMGFLMEHQGLSREEAAATTTVEYIQEEQAADLMGEVFGSTDALYRMAKYDKTLYQKVRDRVTRGLSELILGKQENSPIRTEAEWLVHRLDNALNRLERERGKTSAQTQTQAETEEKTLQDRKADDTMGKTEDTGKEDVEHGRAREETQEDFKRRSLEEGYQFLEIGGDGYGFRRAGQPNDGRTGEQATRSAQTKQELTALGISADVVEGPILQNRNGITTVREVPEAVTVKGSDIFINKDTALAPRNIAGHEAFHLWKNRTGRDAYIETVEDNLLFTSETFREYQSAIAEAYLGGEADLTDSTQAGKLFEEIFAYISGDIHEGTNEATLRPMFRDFDAVKAAWETLVKENGAEAKTEKAPKTGKKAEEKALQDGKADDTMGKTEDTGKEDAEYGRGEDAGPQRAVHQFHEEAERRGQTVRVFERGGTADGGTRSRLGRFTEVTEDAASETARKTRSELKKLGVPSFIHAGDLQVLNGKGDILSAREDSATINLAAVGIADSITIPPKETAGHEAYHFWRGTAFRAQYAETALGQIQWTSPAFSELYDHINENYFNGEFDMENERQNTLFQEELIAYISGQLHNGENLSGLLADPSAVKAAWETLVKENGAEAKTEKAPKTGKKAEDGQSAARKKLLKKLEDGGRVPFAELSQEEAEAFSALSGELGVDEELRIFRPTPEHHIRQRTADGVGARSMNAFQFDFPVVKGFYEQAAKVLLQDAADSLEAPAVSRVERGPQGKQRVQEIVKSGSLKKAMDLGLTRGQTIRGAEALIQGGRDANNAASKRLELVLDDMLSNGYFTMDGAQVSPDAEYLDVVQKIPGYQDYAVEELPLYADADRRFKLNLDFGKQFDEWLERKSSNAGVGSFFVGTTSDALKSIGVSDYKIYWRKAKIAKIMKEHPAMTANAIKSVPNVLEHPVLVMQSQTVANRITLFGEAMDAEGNPVLVAVELSPQNKRGEVQDFAVIASAYGKNGAQQLIDHSDILYVDADKKRTDTWLGLLGLQLPSSLTKYGSIDRVTLVERDVNGHLSVGTEKGKTAMQIAFEKAAEKDRRLNDDIKENTSAQSDLTKREARSAAHKAATGGSVSATSVTQSGRNVNGRFSLKAPVEETKSLIALHNLTEGETTALLQYKSSESYKVNAKLRDGLPLTEAEQTMVDELDRALEKLPVREGVVYRRMSFDMEGQEALDAFLAEHEADSIVPYRAYTSSSTAIDGYPVNGELTATLVISSKTGRDMAGIGNNNESEILFARNTRFYVEKVGTDEGGKAVIYMEEVTNHGAGQLHSEERLQTMQQVQASSGKDGELQKVPSVDPRRGADRRGVPRVRGEGDEKVKFSIGTTEAEDGPKETAMQIAFEKAAEKDWRFKVNLKTGFEQGSIEDSLVTLLQTGDKAQVTRGLQALVDNVRATEEAKRQQSIRNAFQPKRAKQDAAQTRVNLDALIQKFGEMEQTGAAQREVHFPKKIDPDTRVRGFVQTAAAAGGTTQLVEDSLAEDILRGAAGTTYVPWSDKRALSKAEKALSSQEEFNRALRRWETVLLGEKMPSKDDIAVGEALYLQACAEGQVFEAQKRAAELAVMGTQMGQAIQAMSLVKRMTPAGQLYYVTKAVERLNRTDNLVKRGVELKLDTRLAKKLMDAKTAEEVQAAMEAITQDLANQMPVTVVDKWNAWRYFAMLGNPRTHFRNLIGNAVFAPTRLLKDVVATTMETGAVRAGLMNKSERTKGKATKDLKEFAKADALRMEEELRGSGKHNMRDAIMDKRQIFKTPLLEKAAKKNTELLEKEDWMFLHRYYEGALAGFLSARGFRAEQVYGPNSTPEGRAALDQGRKYAMQEARKATYRDMSRLAQNLNYAARNSGPVFQVLWGGLMPFTKTPINIVKRGVEYSPFGVAKAGLDLVASRAAVHADADTVKGRISRALSKVGNDSATPAEVIDELAAGFTGTGLVLLGYVLAQAGLLVGGLGDDEEDQFKKLQGYQSYSLMVGDKSFTIDWAAPTVLPLFVGEAMHRMAEGEEIVGATDFLDALPGLLDPVIAMSMLDGINKTLESIRYSSDNAFQAILGTIFASYISQGMPTVLGAVARTLDEDRRTTFIPKGQSGIERWVNNLWQSSVLGKTPIASKGRMAFVDNWGRKDTNGSFALRAAENFLLPGYLNTIDTTTVETELNRLAEATGDTGVYPGKAQKYFRVNGQGRVMSQDEYEAHLMLRGQKSFELVDQITNSRTYAKMEDGARAQAVKTAYQYAADLAKLNTDPNYAADKWVVKLVEYEKQGGDPTVYIMLRAKEKTADISLEDQILAGAVQSGREAAGLLLIEEQKVTEFADPYSRGYVFRLDQDQQKRYEQIYHDLFVSACEELMEDREFQEADAAERKKLFDELKRDTRRDAKEAMADWLEDRGIESVERE